MTLAEALALQQGLVHGRVMDGEGHETSFELQYDPQNSAVRILEGDEVIHESSTVTVGTGPNGLELAVTGTWEDEAYDAKITRFTGDGANTFRIQVNFPGSSSTEWYTLSATGGQNASFAVTGTKCLCRGGAGTCTTQMCEDRVDCDTSTTGGDAGDCGNYYVNDRSGCITTAATIVLMALTVGIFSISRGR